jgi:signal transduction histidine kinase
VEIPLSHSVDSCIKLLNDSATAKNIKLYSQITENQSIIADANMIETILRNLISNAIKFTPKGGEISVFTEKKEDFIGIVVKDSGVGISEEVIEILMNSQDRISAPGTDNEKGTGLGLIVCKEFVNINNGIFEIHSAPGEGSRIAVYFPCVTPGEPFH